MNKDIILKELDKLSTLAFKKGEIPVGAVVVYNNKIVGKGYNNRQYKKLVTGHAEIMAINKAAKRLGDWRLDGCDLYVTLAPCKMCLEVIKNSRIKSVYYLLDNNSNSYQQVILNLVKIDDENYIQSMENKLNRFFKKMRK